VGRVLGGRYLVGPLVGAGAMGRVYRAQHLPLGRTCAIKVIRAPQPGEGARAEDPSAAIARFHVEAVAGGRLDHPNVVRVLDFGSDPDDGLFYLVTEHLEGEDLSDVLDAEGVLPLPRMVAIARQACSGLAHAHERGVVHRDLKPGNLRLVPREDETGRSHERLVLLDFGAAQIEPDEGLPRTRPDLGTPAYMAPEQVRGARVDGRADVYACGVLLFEMATGRLPFERSSAEALAEAHLACEPPRPSSLRPDLDPELEEIILWCLRKDPAERPQSARDLRDALDGLQALRRSRGGSGSHLPVTAPKPTRPKPTRATRAPRFTPGLSFGAGLSLGLLAAIVASTRLGALSPPAPPREAEAEVACMPPVPRPSSVPARPSRPALRAHDDEPGKPAEVEPIGTAAPTARSKDRENHP
jgi:serine/threonine-protein kinase